MYIVADIDRNCNIFFKYFLENPQLFALNPIHSRFLDKKPCFSLKTLNNLQNLPYFSHYLEGMNSASAKSLKKREAEKTKRESEAPTRNKRYTEIAHKKKTIKKENNCKTRSTLDAFKRGYRIQERIRPPSKSETGRRFKPPRKREETQK